MILGLDISTSITGYTILDNKGKVVDCAHIDLRKHKNFFQKVLTVENTLKDVATEHHIDQIYIEQSLQSFRSGFSSAQTLSLLSNNYQRVPQDHSKANLWRKRSQNDGKIDWRMSAYSIHNLVRGLTKPYSGAHFDLRGKLIKVWKTEIIKSNNQALYNNSLDNNGTSADMVDQASSYTDKNVEMRAINRQIKLISKIDKALKKIKDDTYGYCAETGEPIGIKRLIARPIATLCIAAQEKHEKEEKVYADL